MDNSRQSYLKKPEEPAKNINKILLCQGNGYYCDRNFKLNRFTNLLSHASFMPLFSGITDSEEAQAVKNLAERPAYLYKGMPKTSCKSRYCNSAKQRHGSCLLNRDIFP